MHVLNPSLGKPGSGPVPPSPFHSPARALGPSLHLSRESSVLPSSGMWFLPYSSQNPAWAWEGRTSRVMASAAASIVLCHFWGLRTRGSESKFHQAGPLSLPLSQPLCSAPEQKNLRVQDLSLAWKLHSIFTTNSFVSIIGIMGCV